MPNIVVLNQLAKRHIKMLQDVTDNITVNVADISTAIPFMRDADILAAWGWDDIRELCLQAPNLKWVNALSAGVENIPFSDLQSRSITVTNSKGIHGIPVAEHVFSLILAFSRGLNHFIRNQQNSLWQRVPVNEIHEKSIGIIGLGSIGRKIAQTAKNLGMKVYACKSTMTDEIFVDCLFSTNQLPSLLSEADFVVLAVPLTDETNNFFRLDHFKMMKKSAYFINISRGAVVCEPDLLEALRQGEIQGAGLDVFAHEPLPNSSPLWQMSNVIITPHVAALSPVYLDRAVKLFADNLNRFVQGHEMFNVIDTHKGY